MINSPVVNDQFKKYDEKQAPAKTGASLDNKAGTAPYKTNAQMQRDIDRYSMQNPNSLIGVMNNESKQIRNNGLKNQASALANRMRNREYEQRWYKGEKPTTAEYYSAIRKAQEIDRNKADEIALAFQNMQKDPNSEYYEPYLYGMTNKAVAEGIYNLLGVDISGGVTQADINELKKYADYSNLGIAGTPLESGNVSQQLAYWTYQLEKDEKTTQQAEKEMEWLNQDIQTLVDKGFSDEYIVKHLDMGAYPTLNKMRESAALGAVTPLNRPIGYSNDYVYGAIWAARNGGTSGSSVKDIANWHDKAGNMYVPDKKAEAARDPESDSYHPYSFGATIDLNPRKELTSSQKKTAENNTEKAKAELEDLKEYASGELKTKTPDEIYDDLTKNQMEMLEEDYPTLAKMEFARMEGSYINLTDTVDFAMPYFKEWINEEYRKRQAEFEALSNKAFENAKAYMNENFGTSFEVNGGGSKNQPAEATKEAASENNETEEEKEEALSASVKPDTEAKAPEVKETHAQEETPSEAPVTPNPYFDIRQIETDERQRTELWEALYDYRRGMPVTDENAAAFIQKYPYLFGGEVGWMGSVRNENGELVPLKTTSKNVDTRRTVLKGGMYAGETELGKTGAELLKAADTAQSNGYYSQHDYVNLLMTLATEIENAKANGVSFEEYINTEGTGANALLKDTTQRLAAYKVAQDATRKQEVLDYGAEIHNLRNAYESGNFDNSYIIVGSEEERAIAEADPANEGKYIWTEDEKNKWQQLIEESYDTVVTSGEIGIYDPKKYYTLADGDVYRIVEEELGYIDEYVNIDDYEMYGVKNDVYHLISNRVKNTLLNDLGIAKAAGITVDEYYNSLGYGSSYDRKKWDRNYDDLTDYVTGLVQKEIEAWRNLEIGLTEDLESAIEEMEWHEYYEDDTDTLNFTEDEIQAVLENGDITEEQANMIRLYNDVKDPEGKKRSLEYWQENGGIDAIKTIMYSNLVKLSSDQIRAKQDANESEPERYVGVVGNRKDGKASLGYVVGTGVKLGATEHKKSWIETWYGFAREDSSGLEKEYRTRFSREEVRNNILSTIETISDAELRDALITELDLYDGDIYDFNYDFTVEHIREKIRKTDEKIAYVQEEVAQYCTPEQARMLNTISSGTNTVLFMAENIALTSLAGATGVPIKGAQVIGSALTTGVTSTAETMNTLMDADVSRDSAILAGAVDGMVQVAVEVSLDRFIGIEGKFSPAKSGKNFRTYMAKGIEGEASEGFLRAAMRYGMQLPDLVGGYALDKAKGGIQETAEELIQDVTSTVITNKALELSGKGEYKDRMTWDEVFKLLEESVIQSLILDVGSDIITAPAKSAKYALNKRQTQLESARKLVQKEMVNGAQLKRVKEQLEKSIADGTLEAKMNEAANISAVEERTAEKIIEKTEELKSSTSQGELQTARGKLEQAQKAAEESANELDAAESLLNEASIPFTQEGTVPTQEEISYYEQATQKYFSAKEQHDKNLESFSEAVGEYETAKEAADEEVKAMLAEAETEARAEIVEEKKQERIQEAEEQVRLYEERAVREKERVLSEIQESTGASDREMERVKEKAQKIIDETAAGQIQTKEELKKRIETKFGGRYAVRFDTEADAEAGWVVRENGKGEIVFNAGVDADTLATSVAVHELVHVAEDSKYYDDLKELALKVQYGENPDAEAVRQAAEQIKTEYAEAGISLIDEQAGREHIAELIEDMFDGNLAWVNRLTREKPNVVTRVFEWVKEKIDYFKNRLKNGKEVANTMRNFERMRKAFEKALNDVASGKANIEADAEISTVQGVNQGEGTVREMALKRRVEARQKARIAARLMNASNVYRGAGDWTNYSKAISLLYEMGDTSVKPLRPNIIMKGLAESLGIGVYEGKAPAGTTFAKYDKRASSIKLDRNSEIDLAFTMNAIGEKIKELTGINDPSESYTMGDFLYEYMMTPDKDMPNAARQYLENTFMPAVEKIGKEFADAIKTGRNEMITFRNSDEAARLSAYIASRSDKQTQRIGNKLRDLKINLIDSTFAAEVVDMVTGEHSLRAASAYLPYAKRRADQNIQGDVFVDLDGNRTDGYTLKTALKDIKKDEVDDFNTYLVAREAIDRYDAGQQPFKEALTYSQAQEVLRMLEDKHEHFAEAGKRFNDWWNEFMLTYVVAEGFLSAEEYGAMRKVHPNYVSFAREGNKTYRITFAKGHSDLPIIAPLESAIAMVNQFTKRAAQNRFAQVFDGLYQQNNDLGFIATELRNYTPEGRAFVPENADTIETLSADMNENVTDKTDRELKALAATFVEADDAKYGEQVLTVHRKDGTSVKYVVNDKALFDLLSGQSYKTQSEALKIISAVTRFMARATTGINPLFIVKNGWRDFQKSVNYGSWAYTYADGFARWITTFFPTLFDKGRDLEQFKDLGGGGWSVIRLTASRGEKNYKNALFRDSRKFRELNTLQKVGRVFQTPRRIVERFGEAVETTSRLVEYKYGKHDKSTQQGRMDAFMAAMEVTVDFERGGKNAQLLRTFVPFANATIQGTVQNLRMFTDAEKERIVPRLSKSAFNSMLLGAVSAILSKRYMANEEDERKYDELTEEYKRNFVLFPLLSGGEREFVRLPVSQDWATRAFYEFGRQIGSGEYKDETLGNDLFNLALDMVLEPISEATTIISPFFDVGKNIKWNDSPVVSTSLEKFAPEARYNATTPYAFRGLSQALVYVARDLFKIDEDSEFMRYLTPNALEYLTQQYSGVYGQLLIPALGYNKYTGEMDFWGNMSTAARNSFTVDADSYNQVTDAYYENSEFVDEFIYHAKNSREYSLNSSITDEELSDLYSEIAKANSDGGYLNGLEKKITVHKENINKIESDTTKTSAEKADLTEAERERMNQVMREYNDWVNERKSELLGGWKSYRQIVNDANIATLPKAFQNAYESKEEYMMEAMRLKNNGTGKSVLPTPDYTFSQKIGNESVSFVVSEDEKEAFDKMFFDYYNNYLDELYYSRKDYNEISEEDKAELFSKIRSKAQADAKKEYIKNYSN